MSAEGMLAGVSGVQMSCEHISPESTVAYAEAHYQLRRLFPAL